MNVKQTRKSDLFWKSYDPEGNEWFFAQISLYDFSAVKTTDEKKANYLQKLLKSAVRLNSEFLSKWNGFDVKTYLEFDKDWGLGSSSSLTYMVAQWADVNPLLLHFKCYNGSGYDVACAGAELPITYQLIDDTINYTEIDFNPSFKDNLYFVHLNQKQSSKTAIEGYMKTVKKRKAMAKKLTKITESVLKCSTLPSFIGLMKEHEAIIQEHVGLDSVSNLLNLTDFEGGIKSLGAWGGDFILAASDAGPDYVKSYFAGKGFQTVIGYNDMILQPQAVEEVV